jgi:CheY-like chemotaxis protein
MDNANINLLAGAGKRILVVEDEELAQAIAKYYLENLGCIVDFAATGEESLRLVTKNHYDLILMDIGIFDMDGLNIAKKIRGLNHQIKDVPIVALTVHIYESLKKRAQELNFKDYLAKPLTLEDCKKILSFC